MRYRSAAVVSLLGLLLGCARRAGRAGERPDLAQTLIDPIYACRVDSDCVAIPRGQCDQFHKIAVNRHHVADYQAIRDTVCPPSGYYSVVPSYDVEPLMAQCSFAKRTCVMIKAQGSVCGGPTIRRHTCPGGYRCMANRCKKECLGGSALCPQDGSSYRCVDDPDDGCPGPNGSGWCPGVCEVGS